MRIVGISGKSKSGKDALADLLCARHGWVKVSLADPMKRFAMVVFGFTEHQLWGPSEARNVPDARYCEADAWAEARRRLDYESKHLLNQVVDSPASYGPLLAWYRSLLDEFELGREAKALTPRKVLQTFGTEFGRSLNKDVWLDALKRVATEILRGKEDYERTLGLADKYRPRPSDVDTVVVPDVRFLNEVDRIDEWGKFTVRVTRFSAPLPDGRSEHVSETEQDGIPVERYRLQFANVGTAKDVMDFADLVEREARDK